MASSSSYNSPCAACKFLRRKCLSGCIFAPYFPPENPQKFINVHKVFGASNVTKLLNDVLPHQREDAVNSLAYEAEARVRDPVYGCVGVISFLQIQVDRLQKDLDAAKADLIHCSRNTTIPAAMSPHLSSIQPAISRQRAMDHNFHGRRFSSDGGGGFHQPPPPSYLYHNVNRPWNCHYPYNSRGGGGAGGGGGNM
ncbi:protein LATERAL ORGAN BOUNDARIES-like [Cynara cardunculus var. scolymus]|nr:protein LATERAL ORGAN BOUNDARIES-like [Cynara cardunculus var. scolymus]